MGWDPKICWESSRDICRSLQKKLQSTASLMVKNEQHGKGIADVIAGLCRIEVREIPGAREVKRVECSSWRRVVVGDCES